MHYHINSNFYTFTEIFNLTTKLKKYKTNLLNKPLFISLQNTSQKFKINFINLKNIYNFSKSQTNSNMYKSYIHTINFYGKKAIKQVNTQTKYIYYKICNKN